MFQISSHISIHFTIVHVCEIVAGIGDGERKKGGGAGGGLKRGCVKISDP